MPTDRVHCTLTQEQTQNLQAPATTPNTTPPTRHRALHPLPGTTPVTGHYTRYEALHPLRGTAPDQNGRNAYGSGALHTQTRTNAVSESPHHTRHRRTGENSLPTPGATSTARNNTTQARTLTHLVTTWVHPCAWEPTWWHMVTPTQPPADGLSCTQVGSHLQQMGLAAITAPHDRCHRNTISPREATQPHAGSLTPARNLKLYPDPEVVSRPAISHANTLTHT